MTAPSTPQNQTLAGPTSPLADLLAQIDAAVLVAIRGAVDDGLQPAKAIDDLGAYLGDRTTAALDRARSLWEVAP